MFSATGPVAHIWQLPAAMVLRNALALLLFGTLGTGCTQGEQPTDFDESLADTIGSLCLGVDVGQPCTEVIQGTIDSRIEIDSFQFSMDCAAMPNGSALSISLVPTWVLKDGVRDPIAEFDSRMLLTSGETLINMDDNYIRLDDQDRGTMMERYGLTKDELISANCALQIDVKSTPYFLTTRERTGAYSLEFEIVKAEDATRCSEVLQIGACGPPEA